MRRITTVVLALCASLAALAPSAPPPARFSGAGHAAMSAPRMITRPAPPLQHADGFRRHHHHHPGRTFVFVEPPFFGSPAFISPYGYPYSSSFYTFGAFGSPTSYAAPVSTVTAPFFCWVDGIGFSDETRFAHHLHEVHGVPLDDALAASEVVGGHYMFFGY
jgi:hypothetical protein